MEPSDPDDDSANFPLSHFNSLTNQQNMASFQFSALDFPLGSFQPQHQQRTDSGQRHPSIHAATSHPLLPSEVSIHMDQNRGDGLHDFHHSYTFTTNQGLGSRYSSGHDTSKLSLLKMGIADSHTFSGVSFGSLLGTLSAIQHKMQQLQTTVELMAQGSAQLTVPQQQHQVVAAKVASIVSDLVAASSGLLQNSSMPPPLLPASISQVNRMHMDEANVTFVDAQQQDGITGSLFGALGSFMDSANDDNPCGTSTSRGFTQVVSNIGNSTCSSPKIEGSIAVNTIITSVGAVTGAQGNGHGNGLDGILTKLLPSSEDLDCGGLLLKDDDENGDGEILPPGSFELVEMDATEILAEHTHFCEICGKGFKRDANLRMHMRGHGDEYKTPAALARPDKSSGDAFEVRPRRFSCPYVGCKRNKKHRKFQPLKTMLCVKNHYRRSHCPKMFTCSKCKSKQFSVVADLKTHEKHCGQDKWQCSCGTTFSRKDKLFGHIGLFTGHTPAVPLTEGESPTGPGCLPSGHGDLMEGIPYTDSTTDLAQANMPLIPGDGQVIDNVGEPFIGSDLNKTKGLQILPHGSSSSASLSSALVSNSSLIFDGLLSSSFFHQADGSK